jgi:hypothetical protein
MDKNIEELDKAPFNGIGMLQLFADFSARVNRTIAELVQREDFEYLVSDGVVFEAFINARIEDRFIRIKAIDKKETIDCGHDAPLFDIIPVVSPSLNKPFYTSDAIGILSWLEGAVCVSCVLGGAISELNDLDVVGKDE